MEDSSLGESSSVKLKDIEVSAKEIVDRISNLQVTDQPLEKSRQPNPVGMNKLMSGIEQIDEEQLKLAVSAQRNSLTYTSNPLQSSEELQQTAEQKGVEQLLAAVEKWVKEAQLAAEGNGATQDGTRGLDNMHWVYSIESYLRSLDTDWTSQKALTHKICSQLLVWLKQLFHFKECGKDDQEFNSVHPHWDINGGMVAVTQLNLYLMFPRLFNNGYHYFQEENKSPLIYCSDEIVGQQTSCRLGLPYSCVSTINVTDKDWVGLLERKIATDSKKGVVPIALLLNTTASNLEQAVKLAEMHRIWVHFYGANVTAYFLKRPESNQLGHSFTIDLTRWFRTPKVPYLTVYKRPEKAELTVLELCDLGSPRNEIMCFTPWFVAHVFGRPQLTALVNEAIHRGRFLMEMVQRYECLNLVPNWSKLSDGTVIVQALTFQYNPPQFKRSNPADASGEKPENEHSVAYVDTLNSWLYHIMERDMKGHLPIEFVFVESVGWNIHIDVIRCQKHQPDEEATIISTFENHMLVLQATVMQKVKFCKLVRECEELEWVDHETQWAGLGAVRYIPMFHRVSKEMRPDGTSNSVNKQDSSTPPSQNTVDIKENVDHLNAKIVDKLKAIDTAFSLGEAATGEWCVQFGMVTEETDVKELVRLVIATGQDIEESSEFFNRMSELVKKGIEKATEELRKESEEALWEEGILRRVPVVGTFVNWFSPPTKETGVRGRALNLTQGKVESTENIYKYHMQVEASAINSVNKGNSSTHIGNNVSKAKE